MLKLRLSIVGYLNSLPLSWGFIHNQSKDIFDYDFSPPSLCADQIAAGSVDVGLIPAIEYQRITNLKIVPNLSVASKRKVRSVLLVSRVPIQKVRSIALDKSSRTSVALLQVLLKIRFKLNPLLTSHEPDLRKMLYHNDAALLIGDSALTANITGLYHYDLSEEWRNETGKPFVFAFWAVRTESRLTNSTQFLESYHYGISHLKDIVEQQSQKLVLPQKQISNYLEHCIDYSLDKENLEGLLLFYGLANQLGITKEKRELNFI